MAACALQPVAQHDELLDHVHGDDVMTFALTFAGVIQVHLQRVLGQSYMDVQDQLCSSTGCGSAPACWW